MWKGGIFFESELVFKFKFFMFIRFFSCGGIVLEKELKLRLSCFR